MRRRITATGTAAALLAAAGAAHACMNDTQTDYAEREFRSSYQQAPARSTEVLLMGTRPAGLAAVALGGVLAVTGALRVLRRKGEPR